MSEPSPSAHSRDDAETAPPAAPVSAWARLKEHKVLQWSLAYLGASLALAHGQDLLAHNFHWPDSVGHVVIGTLIAGFPLALALAWYHGHRGLTHISTGEMTVLSLLVLLGAVLLVALVRTPRERNSASRASAGAPATTAAPLASASRGPTSAPGASKARLAILPFENLSPDPANAFFADGLHEEIISTLSRRAPDLGVISRTTMMTYRTPKPVEEIARELGATHVLEGSVRREGNAVRLTLQLINARSDQHVWSQSYDRTLVSALTLQSEVARQVATQLAGQLGSSAGAFKPPTRDTQAYDLFLKARLEAESSIRGPATPVEVLQRVEGLLAGALAHDPDFAQARAQRAQMRTLQFVYNYDSAQHARPLVQKDLEAAERLAPEDTDVLFVKAAYLLFFERDPTHAIAALEAASPEALDPIWLAASAEMYYSVGRFETAIQRTQRALTLDPKNVLVYAELIRAFLLARKPLEALRVADLASVEFPADFPFWRDRLRWDFTGLGSPSALASIGPLTPITGSTTVDSANFFLFLARVAHLYPQMSTYLGQTKTETIRGFFTAGAQPVAELRGWVHLLGGDRAAAAQDGRDVLSFVAHTEETKWNRVSLDLLTAEGNTFLGEKHRAIEAADKALRHSESVSELQHVPPLAAAVYAWSGAEDEAASLLEQLSVRLPAVMFFGPATIVRDPLYNVPLAGNARYRALTAKLEAQMAATKLP